MIAACYGVLGITDLEGNEVTITCNAREQCGRFIVATKALHQHDPAQQWLRPAIDRGNCKNWIAKAGQGQ